jgi:hypothetical protein
MDFLLPLVREPNILALRAVSARGGGRVSFTLAGIVATLFPHVTDAASLYVSQLPTNTADRITTPFGPVH